MSLLRVFFTALLSFLVFGGSAFAAQPKPWQLGLQPSATPLMEQVDDFHNLLMIVITLITVFVTVLLLWVSYRYRAKRNPKPSQTTHNTLVEVIWTFVPIIILVVIAIPSFRLLYFSDKAPEGDVKTRLEARYKTKIDEMSIKVTGHQWYWSYVYDTSIGGQFKFEARLLCKTKSECKTASKELGRPALRLLDSDNEMVVPVNTLVRLYVTGADVIHAWTIPASGTKIDAVPGRTNEIWVFFPAAKKGRYYGQCSELCGAEHAYMPITLNVVSRADYKKWLAESWKRAKEEEKNFSVAREPKKVSMLRVTSGSK